VSNVQERHMDYVWSLPTLQPAQPMTIKFQFDPDAPFALRGLAARMPYDAAGTQNGLQSVSLRWSGPVQDYRQQSRVPLGIMMGAYFGQYGNPRPVYPQVRFPENAVTWIDVINNGAAPLAGVQLFYRGVKLGKPGQWAAQDYTYPAKMRTIPYSYPQIVSTLAVTDNGPHFNQIFRVRPGGDFAFRAGQAGRSFAPSTWEVFITLRDGDSKPYSNAPVHVDVLFGQSVGRAAYACGTAGLFVAPIGPGASAPGLLYPEIYLPSDHIMLYDITRNDAAYGGAAPATFPLNFIGSKVVAG
jgi:hypothetical protein